mmetsp:Transcript_49248/g.79813  ORF Transcript_49248/g.79813 Transcript_49248/m.79813 type:complete len:246 (-) Transcript_49248:365-1102(-)
MSRASVFEHPIIHGSAILVLDGSECVGHALERIDHRAGEVVRGVGLVLEAMLVVRRVGLAAVEDRVSQALVGARHVHLGTDAALQAFLRALEHLAVEPEILFHRQISLLALGPRIALCPHGVHVRVVHVALALLQQALHDLLQMLKVVRSVSHHIWLDLQSFQVLDHTFFKLHLLLAWVRVVESQDQLALVVASIVVVEHGCLGMPNVQVSARLRGEARDNLALNSAWQQSLELGLILALVAGCR